MVVVEKFVEGKIRSIVDVGFENIRGNEATIVVVAEYKHPKGYTTLKRFYFPISVPSVVKIPIYKVERT